MIREDGKLTIHWHKTGDFTPPYEHCELVLHGLARAPRSVTVDGDTYSVVQNDPVRHTSLLGIPLFESLEVVL